MAAVSPTDAQTVVVEVLRRALHGPNSPGDAIWPGVTRPPLVVRPDHGFADWKSLNEALVTDDGEEVLGRAPTNVYGIGVLFPQMTAEQEEELDAAQTAVISDDVTAGPSLEVPEITGAGEAEETVQVPHGGTRPRSIAVTFHLPADVDSIAVTVSGGVYRPLPVVVDGRSVDLWRRQSIEHTVQVDPTVSGSYPFEAEGLRLQVGVRTSPSPQGHLVTVYLANLSPTSGHVSNRCLFQTRIGIDVPAALPYPTPRTTSVRSDSFDLLYRDHLIRAVGHGTDAVVEDVPDGVRIRTETLPVVALPPVSADITDTHGNPYGVGMDDLAQMNTTATTAVNRLLADYRHWIDARERETQGIVKAGLRTVAERHLSTCREFLTGMEEGWDLLAEDATVRQCLQWASHAMNAQRVATTAPLRATTVIKTGRDRTHTVGGVSPHTGQHKQGRWRAFQVAFLLASLPATVDPHHPNRHRVDIIWMPTGGGKTEAYLGLSAFTLLWLRRQRMLADGEPPVGVDVLMRYTLRLLTAQQVQRASAMICALEVLRTDPRNAELLGNKPFRIGAYLGQASTPNRRQQAVELWSRLDSSGGDRGGRGFLLTRCPWCGAQMGAVAGGIAGYRKVPTTIGEMRVAACCPDDACPFGYSGDPSRPGGLPVLEVDEDIYAVPPAFLVGTIDKFAQLSWRPQARSLFGLRGGSGNVYRKADPPSLLIQDELHLIAGPLGSLDALYEVAIEELCETIGGRRPVIIAATATTKDYDRQVLRLYGRSDARLVPPPALDIGDNFFSRTSPDQPAKVYVGVCAPGFGSAVNSQLRTLAALNHAGGTLEVMGADADPWWTNLAFFSSRRALGLQLSACQTGLENATFSLSRLSGLAVGRLTERGTRHARRAIGPVKELTATSQDNVTELLAHLDLRKGQPQCVDLCFATSMVEVGVDVPRLGLMTVMGQPKSYSQYIQVTGRVGRSPKAPGVVVVVLGAHNVRDRSHYETFTASHRRLYASVEPVSITPFTPQALERGLAGALTGVLRPTTDRDDPQPLLTPEHIDAALEPWRRRAGILGDPRAHTTLTEEQARLTRLATAAVNAGTSMTWDLPPRQRDGNPLMVPLDEDGNGAKTRRWRVPLSMRSVDKEAGVTIPRQNAPARATARRTVTDDGEDFQ